MQLSDAQVAFLQDHHAAAMITIRKDGMPGPVRVGVAIVDGRLWSSGTQRRARTARLRRDPRCSLFFFDPGYRWLGIEASVAILDGPDADEQNLQLFRVMQGRPTGQLTWFGDQLDESAFLVAMRDEQRLIYEFDVQRAYGMV
jgi:hypothetical protein